MKVMPKNATLAPGRRGSAQTPPATDAASAIEIAKARSMSGIVLPPEHAFKPYESLTGNLPKKREFAFQFKGLLISFLCLAQAARIA